MEDLLMLFSNLNKFGLVYFFYLKKNVIKNCVSNQYISILHFFTYHVALQFVKVWSSPNCPVDTLLSCLCLLYMTDSDREDQALPKPQTFHWEQTNAHLFIAQKYGFF